VYATDGYSQSVTNLGQITLATDNVFGDDSAARELATITGNVTDGFTAQLTVAVDPSATETGGGAPPSGEPPSGAPSDDPSGSPSASPSATATTTASATASTSASATVSPSATAKPTPAPHRKKKHRHWWWPF